MTFASDNTSGVAPEIMAALAAANQGIASGYGADDITRRLDARFADVFEREVAVFPVATGTAANALSLSCLTPPYGAIFCHAGSHIQVDECGAPELFTGGAKLRPLPGAHGKLAPEVLDRWVVGAENVHSTQPAAVSLTQATEAGTLYKLDELVRLSEVARRHRLKVQMDGARFANALVALDCSPAEMTWKAGVDVLAFGATKNGALAAEAVVFFDPALADSFGYRRKRGGHLFSKMRFLSAQLEAYLDDDLWLRNARHANAMAARLAQGLAAQPMMTLVHPVESNQIFLRLPVELAEALRTQGHAFYDWDEETGKGGGSAAAETTVRLVTAFNTTPETVDGFLADVTRLAGSGRVRAAGT